MNMRGQKDAAFKQQRGFLMIKRQRVHPIDFLKRTKRLMASIVAWLIGLLFLGLGCWILLLRFEGLIDHIWPHNMLIGQMTVDGKESKGHAELLRARFDHHFRRPVAIAKETGFIEVLTLDTPELFQQEDIDAPLKKMTVEVKGVDVGFLFQLVNQLAQPDRWVIEGDFQIKSDRALLALRMRRGQRMIRTWYLERLGNTAEDKSMLLEKLIDDAIFQLAYDFGNKAEQDEDLQKWREVLPPLVDFPSREAVAAYYEGRGALGRYYAYGDWRDLDLAIARLRTLRSQMPEYANGLKMLGMALAEKRCELEAIHVFEQLELLLRPDSKTVSELTTSEKRRYLPIMLLKATATTKLYTWQSTHAAIRELLELDKALTDELSRTSPESIKACQENDDPANQQRWPQEQRTAAENYAAFCELRAQTAIQLAYAYALYLSYVRNHTVHDMFANADAPLELQFVDPTDREILRVGPFEASKQLVRQTMVKIKTQHEKWIHTAEQEQTKLNKHLCVLSDHERRQAELTARLNLAAGYAHYRMAELEEHSADESRLILGATYQTRLNQAAEYLRKAEAAHPNHYLVLQFLGLVYAEPRRDARYLSIAEQYIERAILANPADYYGHALLARILLRRVANSGLDIENHEMLKRGLNEAQIAVAQREYSGMSHLLRAQFLTLLLEIEREDAMRRELRLGLEQSIFQAARFLPHVFDQPDVDLTWIEIVAATRQLGEVTETIHTDTLAQQKQRRFEKSKQALIATINKLIKHCDLLEERWVARQRVFLIEKLEQRARNLRSKIETSNLENWREIKIQVF
jgi:hypothetical protein